MGQYVNLHAHTSHSVRDGMADVAEMVDRAVELGQPAVAVTDHGTLSGAWKLAQAAAAAGIKPIIGSEVYLSVGPRRGREVDMLPGDLVGADGAGPAEAETPAPTGFKSSTFRHLTVLAQNTDGYRNLSLMCAEAADSFWMKPRMDLDLIREHHDGLILLTGCLSGPVAGALLRDGTRRPDGTVHDGWAAARHAVEELIGLFDGRDHRYIRDHLYVEVMDHGIAAERALTPRLLELADIYGLRAVATNDSHYVHPADHDTHDLWLCIRSSSGGKPVPFADRRRVGFAGDGYHLRSYAEMAAAFARYGDAGQDALRQSLVVADLIDDTVLPQARPRLPAFPTPDGFDTAVDYLRHLVERGAADRYGQHWRGGRPDVLARIRHEFGVIRRLGLADYFLIVHDVVNWARDNGIRVGPGRGSAAGSCVSYCLGIVQVDPIATGLLFERFLDDTREEMPDIDLDFDQAGQPRVFDYLSRRWGTDRVARLGTFGFARARYALRSAARVLLPSDRSGRVAESLTRLVPGPQHLLGELADPQCGIGAPIREKARSSADTRLVFDAAVRLEGVLQSEGVHACGVVIATEPLAPMVPLRRDRRAGRGNAAVTQWDGRDIAELGLLKLDVLGLRNLDIISDCVRQIGATTGEIVDPEALSTDPGDRRVRATWSMLGAGRTAGVFQLESSGLAKLASEVRPENLEDLSALVALYRPGPLAAGFHERYARRKHGLEPVDYSIFTEDPGEQEILATVLAPTFGLIVYQEQIMQLGAAVAGFGPAENNRLRRAVSKKKQQEMQAVGRLFVDGAVSRVTDENGAPVKPAFGPASARRIWDGMKGAGNYSFNKSHSYAYGTLAYVTAFLKANWPAQYGAATLAHTDSDERRAATLAALRDEGIEVLGPSVVTGQVTTTCDGDRRIRLGLAEIKGVGADLAQAIVAARDIRGAFAGLGDLTRSVTLTPPAAAGDDEPPERRAINAGQLQALIEAGACDSFGPRKGQLMVLPALRQHPGLGPVDAEFSGVERAGRERARLGALLSPSPLQTSHPEIASWRTPAQHIKPLPVHKLPSEDGAPVVTLGVLGAVTMRAGATGPRAHITLEGSKGSVSGIIWPRTVARLERAGTMPAAGDVVALRGRVGTREVTPTDRDQEQDDDNATGDGLDDQAAEPEYVREIQVDDVYPVSLKDDSSLSLPETPSLIDLIARGDATEAPPPQPEDSAPTAVRPRPLRLAPLCPATSDGGADPSPIIGPAPAVDDRRAKRTERRPPVPELPVLLPTARLTRPTIRPPASLTARPGQTRVLIFDLPAGANPVYSLGATRASVLSRWPGLEPGSRTGGLMLTPIDLRDLRPGECSRPVPAIESGDLLIVRITPAGTEPGLRVTAVDDPIAQTRDTATILDAVGEPNSASSVA